MLASRPPTSCRWRLFLPCLVLLVVASTLRAQQATTSLSTSKPAVVTADSEHTTVNQRPLVSQLGNDFATIGRDPWFHALIAGMLVAPLALKHEDPEINEAWAGEGTIDQVFEAGNTMGNTLVPAAGSVLAYTTGKLTHSDRATVFASDLFRAHLINAMATLSLKGIINRDRPDGTRWGFPSGHTSTAFTSAAVIQTHFGNWWGASAYLAASYVGLSRLQENRHYLSDVIAGALLGTYIGKRVAHRPDHASPVSITPGYGSTGVGATLTLRF